MRVLIPLALVWCLLVGAASAQYHDPVYVMGGYMTTSTLYGTGFWLGDAKVPSYTKLVSPSYSSSSVKMDADNRRILFTVRGSISTAYPGTVKSGIFRYDPALKTLTTVQANTMTLYNPYHIHVTQDGDYVFGCQEMTTVSPRVYNFNLLRLSAGGTLSTLLTSTKLGGTTSFNGYISRNMDTGNFLVSVSMPRISPTLKMSGGLILDVAADGSFTTFSTGGNNGWVGNYNMPQDHDTGWIEGQYSNTLYRIKPGTTPRNTLWHLGRPGGHNLQYTCEFDLQSAPSKRWVSTGYYYGNIGGQLYYAPVTYYIDHKTWAVTYVNLDPHKATAGWRNYSYAFTFYRGRHLQTIKKGPGLWDILINCPNHPGKNYLLLMSAAGYRPGLLLPDGRRLHLNHDTFFTLSLGNLLKPYFDAGPLVLDASGKAQGALNVSALPLLNMPVWIALAVMDPAAPLGIAYLPDTYVMRL